MRCRPACAGGRATYRGVQAHWASRPQSLDQTPWPLLAGIRYSDRGDRYFALVIGPGVAWTGMPACAVFIKRYTLYRPIVCSVIIIFIISLFFSLHLCYVDKIFSDCIGDQFIDLCGFSGSLSRMLLLAVILITLTAENKLTLITIIIIISIFLFREHIGLCIQRDSEGCDWPWPFRTTFQTTVCSYAVRHAANNNNNNN